MFWLGLSHSLLSLMQDIGVLRWKHLIGLNSIIASVVVGKNPRSAGTFAESKYSLFFSFFFGCVEGFWLTNGCGDANIASIHVPEDLTC